MIRIGVIEDDSNMRKIVSQIIEKEIQGYEEVKQKTFESTEEFLQERAGYDIVISDIELPGINGIELGKRLSKEGKQTKLIYLTSYPEYAWESYLVEAFQYVLKIDMQERLPEIVGKVLDELIKENKNCRIFGNSYKHMKLYYNSYLDMLFQAVSKMLELNLNRQSVVVSYERIRELEERELETEMDGRYILQERIQEVALQQVQFAYRQEEPVLERLSCSVEEAGLYSLVGKNGCGKTTILKLLERLYDPDEGQVCINGRDIREYQISALRSRIAYMEKEPFFIRGTVYENLRMGNEEVSEEQMEEACKRTGIHRDIMEMDQQYRTVLEESGRNLSSGQKQKLGLARLFLRKNVSLYLLDEITSDLDGSAERQIADQLEELTRDTIVFSVSHKEELLKRSKCIFLIYGGKIVESGTHEELMEESRQYQKLYRPKE